MGYEDSRNTPTPIPLEEPKTPQFFPSNFDAWNSETLSILDSFPLGLIFVFSWNFHRFCGTCFSIPYLFIVLGICNFVIFFFQSLLLPYFHSLPGNSELFFS